MARRILLLLILVYPPSGATASALNFITVYSAPQAREVATKWRPGGPANPREQFGDALVESARRIQLKEGINQVDLGGIGEAVDPTSLRFVSVTDPHGTRVLEQQVLFPNTDQSSLLKLYRGRSLQLEQDTEHGIQVYRGLLLDGQNGLLLKTADGSLLWAENPSRILYPSPPADLATDTTARLSLKARTAGEHLVRIRYETGGLTWWADYDLELDDTTECRLTISPWVTLLNRSGADYRGAQLRLVAGEPRRSRPPAAFPMARMVAAEGAPGGGFAEQAVGDYHLYSLDGLIDLDDGSLRQIALFDTQNDLPCRQRLLFESSPGYRASTNRPIQEAGFGLGQPQPVRTFLSFDNNTESGLGRPLPAGQVRVSSRLADNTLVLLGENQFPHTPAGIEAQWELGSAFDVRGERRQVDFNLDSARRTMEEEFELNFTNAKKKEVRIEVRETLYRWHKAEIVSSSLPPGRPEADAVEFDVTVPPKGRASLRYRVRYGW